MCGLRVCVWPVYVCGLCMCVACVCVWPVCVCVIVGSGPTGGVCHWLERDEKVKPTSTDDAPMHTRYQLQREEEHAERGGERRRVRTGSTSSGDRKVA